VVPMFRLHFRSRRADIDEEILDGGISIQVSPIKKVGRMTLLPELGKDR